jgi:crossover junction endodeoxyribonuclease RusA
MRNGLVLEFSLPIPPSANHCYRRVTKGGRRMNVMTNTAKRWYEAAQATALEEAQRIGWVRPDGLKVVVEYTVYWPDRRERDVHNLLKVMMDALQVVTGKDRWALPRAVDFSYDRENPRVELRIYRKEGN